MSLSSESRGMDVNRRSSSLAHLLNIIQAAGLRRVQSLPSYPASNIQRKIQCCQGEDMTDSGRNLEVVRGCLQKHAEQ